MNNGVQIAPINKPVSITTRRPYEHVPLQLYFADKFEISEND